MAIFTATFSAVAVTAAQDLFELLAPADADIEILKVTIGQYSDFGDAQAEILPITVIRGFTTTGSGGSSVTPANVKGHTGALASTTTVKANNTTVATTGTTETLIADTFNVAAGWFYDESDPLNRRQRITVKKAGRIVFRTAAPADSLTMNGTIWFEEIGQGPA